MTTLEKVQAQIAKLQAQAETLITKRSSGILAKIRDMMEKHGLTTADIDAHINGSKKRGRKPGVKTAMKSAPSAAKYRDPKSGATWTGHGRAPAWIANAKDRNKFLMADASESSASVEKKTAKVGNYVRGPQAPKYRDPATGATWSGRGKAPSWLAGATDRAVFLIAGLGERSTKPKAAKKVAAKKAAAKKVGNKEVAARERALKDVAAKKVAAKKTSASAKKVPAKNATTKKVTAKKADAKNSVAAPRALTQAIAPASAAAAESTAA